MGILLQWYAALIFMTVTGIISRKAPEQTPQKNQNVIPKEKVIRYNEFRRKSSNLGDSYFRRSSTWFLNPNLIPTYKLRICVKTWSSSPFNTVATYPALPGFSSVS